jgi:Tol biopolymer transport system component
VTTRASVSDSGTEGNSVSMHPSISADGRFVAFCCFGDNLVPGDTNGWADVFVRDRQNGTTKQVSVSSSGAPGNKGGYAPAISADGRWTAFSSYSTNLVVGDTNGVIDVFVHDRESGLTERVSVDSSGLQGNGTSDNDDTCTTVISGDGRYVVFESQAGNLVPGGTNGYSHIFVRDRQAGVTELVSVDSFGTQANYLSERPTLSTDGRFVAFVSFATNLVPGDANGHVGDIFVHDRLTGATEFASVSAVGAQGDNASYYPAISSNGRFVAFLSGATNLVSGDTNGVVDFFVRDRLMNLTERVSVDSSGVQGNDGSSWNCAVSSDGRYVAFDSYATNLVPDDTNGLGDIFVRDRQAGITERVNVDSAGQQCNSSSRLLNLSVDGRFVVFGSSATNLVLGDTNGSEDVFVRDRFGCTPENYCTAKVNSAGCTPSIVSLGAPSVTPGKRFLIGATQVLEHHTGILFYGVHGPIDTAFQGGRLCVSAPTQRTRLQMSQSSGAPPCAGVFSFDFNGHIASGVDPALALGRQVWAQYWMRDAASPSGTGLSDALTFAICQ